MPLVNFKNWKEDILSGIIVALVSIPISMGYAQIAGLPPVYGLYGSLFPILLFGLITSSPQFVIGVDAMPAVMVGTALTGMGLMLGSDEAVMLVPVISFLTGIWFLVFRLFNAGRIVKYISTPVMGGFISGIGATIILMQMPKLFGGNPGTGELPALIVHLLGELQYFHVLSAFLGISTVAVILIGKRIAPKFPFPVLMMVIGVILTAVFRVDRLGVKLLPTVQAGLPPLKLPNLSLISGHGRDLIALSLSIALVVMAQTLLASNNYAMKYGYTLDTGRELLGYAAAELAGSLVGCCPVNGSVSRSGIADQFGCKSQLMSITAFVTMLIVLLFGTGLLQYLPVPILTGIVIAALAGILEIRLARRLRKTNTREFFIFLTAFFGVLFFGTVYGVIIGVVLSFFSVVVRAVVPPKAFLGQISGHEGFYDLRRNRSARALKNTVIYRFSGNLFFANIDTFISDIESAVQTDTKQIIVDGSGIANIDITAADRLVQLNKQLRTRGIRLYLTEHVGTVNDQLRKLGAGELIENGTVRRTIALALRDCGMETPYLQEDTERSGMNPVRDEKESYAEFEWLFGDDAEERFDHLAAEIARMMSRNPDISLDEAERRSSWGRVGLFDEDMLLDYVELNLEEMEEAGSIESQQLAELEEQIEEMRPELSAAVIGVTPKTREYMKQHSEQLRQKMAQRHPRQVERMRQHRKELLAKRERYRNPGADDFKTESKPE